MSPGYDSGWVGAPVVSHINGTPVRSSDGACRHDNTRHKTQEQSIETSCVARGKVRNLAHLVELAGVLFSVKLANYIASTFPRSTSISYHLPLRNSQNASA